MTENAKRYMELMGRLGTLETVKEKVKEQVTNKGMLMLLESMEEGIEDKLNGQLIMIERWIKEIEEEKRALEETVFAEFLTDAYKKTKDHFEGK